MESSYKARLINQSALFRSFPLSRVRAATPGLSLNLIGSVNKALERSLSGTHIAAAIHWPVIGLAQELQPSYLMQALNSCNRADWTIVTDLDCARLLLNNPDILIATRLITRATLLFPVQWDLDEVLTSGFSGMCEPEFYETLCWRWIVAADGMARFTASVAPHLEDITWSFEPMFATVRYGGLPSKAKLVVGDVQGMRELQIVANRRENIQLNLRSGPNIITFGTDLPLLATEADSRTLSLAVLQPEFLHRGRVVLGPERFLAGDGVPALSHVRRTMHAFGFERVTGTVCSSGALPIYRPVPQSTGNPLTSILGKSSSLLPEDDIATGQNEVVWLFCGDAPGE